MRLAASRSRYELDSHPLASSGARVEAIGAPRCRRRRRRGAARDHRRRDASARHAARRRMVGLLRRIDDRADDRRRHGRVRDRDRHRRVGPQSDRGMGLRHHKLRVLDRHRPRGKVDFGDSPAAPAAVAHGNQSIGGGDDDLRRDVRRALSIDPHGRPWLAFWVMPYPNSRGPLWVNFRSPLLWDVFAINTYLTISLVFWYLGMIPDFATMRDRTDAPVRRFAYSVLSLGWNGSARTWSRYETATTLLAGLAT